MVRGLLAWRLLALLLALLLLGAACGGPPRGAGEPGGHGAHGTRGVEAAALPYKILRAQGGGQVPEADFWRELAGARAICVGESHRNPHHHWAQLRVIEELSHAPGVGGLGLEMFQRPVQGVLDDYRTGAIDEAALLSRTGWETRWGYDYALYRPLVGKARAAKMDLVALNAPEELTHKVAKQGLASLTREEKATLPDLDLQNDAHRAYFKEAMEGHAMKEGEFENFYTAQVIWDETMADTAWRWLNVHPDRRMIILAGLGHCHGAAIPARLERRGVDRIVSVQPVIDDGEGNVAHLLAKPENDFLFVMSMRAQ